jgi:ribonuclease HII
MPLLTRYQTDVANEVAIDEAGRGSLVGRVYCAAVCSLSLCSVDLKHKKIHSEVNRYYPK